MSLPVKNVRTSFTADEDTLLMKYIATYNPTKKNRSGNALYKYLEANVDNKWNWSRTHSWQSWQNRYRKNMDEFDRKILKYQKKKGIDPEKQSGREPQVVPSDEEAAKDRSKETSKGKKRAGGQDSTEQRKAKRAKLEKDQPDAGSSRSPLIKADETRQIPAVGPSDQARTSHPYNGPSETVSDVPLPSPKQASTFDLPSLPSRSDTLPVLSSQLNSPPGTLPPISSQLPPSSQPLASSSQQVKTPKLPSGPKRALKHMTTFGSPSPIPDRPPPLRTKNLPKMVEGHFRRALTDRLGHVRPGARSHEKQTVARPLVGSKKGKEKEVAQGLTALTPSAAQERERHPINEVESQTSRLAVVPPKCEPESQRPPAPLPPHRIESEHHPFSQVPYPPPPHPPHNRSGADAAESPLKHRSANGVGYLDKSLWDRKRDNVKGSASLIAQPAAGFSKLTNAAVPSDLASSAEPPHGQPVDAPSSPPTGKENTRLPNAPSLAQISTGSASSTTAAVQQIQVPSKEDFAPVLESNSIVLPQDRNSHSTVSAPHKSNVQPLLTPGSPFLPSNTDKSEGKGKQRHAEPPVTHARRLLNRSQKRHRRKTVSGYDLPRMDLRTLSAVPTSRIPRSRGSSSSSHLSHRHPLPVHSTPSAIPADLSGHLITPGPAIPPVPYALITPVDIPLSASVGFRSFISHIAAANGFSPDVVLEVYKRVGSLKATEECVRGMRNASECWIEAKLQQREREARKARRASNERESRESDHSDDEPLRGSRHQPSLQQALPERRLPNGLRVRHEPGSDVLEYEPLPRKKAAPKKVASSEGDSMGASWRVGAVGRYRTNQAEDEAAETAVDSSEGSGDEAASGEDEENSDDVKQAEEESVVARLVSESLLEDLQDQDDPQYHTDNEPEPAPPDAEQLDEDDQHHEFSLRELPHAHIKRESLPPPLLHKSHGDSAQNGEEVLNGALSDVRLTRSVSPTWNVDEGIPPLSGNGQVHQMLERRLGKQGMRKRVAQLLR